MQWKELLGRGLRLVSMHTTKCMRSVANIAEANDSGEKGGKSKEALHAIEGLSFWKKETT